MLTAFLLICIPFNTFGEFHYNFFIGIRRYLESIRRIPWKRKYLIIIFGRIIQISAFLFTDWCFRENESVVLVLFLVTCVEYISFFF